MCHPHPLMGGNMDNPVVMWVCRALNAQGLATLRFNFRGVGNSQGVHTKGEKETADLKAALDLLGSMPGIDKKKTGLAGYSFGSGMIISAFSKFKVCKAFCLISPPSRYYQESAISKDKRPRQIISGDQDRSVAPQTSRHSWAPCLNQPIFGWLRGQTTPGVGTWKIWPTRWASSLPLTCHRES